MGKALLWDITVDILSRLPVDDLLRFRAVSKPWCSLIDSPDFVKLHLSRSAEARVVFGVDNKLYWVDPEAMDSPRQLSYPMDIGTKISVIGSCNGLIALVNTNEDITLWNPSTRNHITLPKLAHPPPTGPGEIEYGFTGLGYDPVNDDYKFLGMVNYVIHFPPSRFHLVNVYSLRAKAWKRTRDHFPAHLRYTDAIGGGIFVNNALHWVATRASDGADGTDALVAFDLATEEVRELPMLSHPDLAGFRKFSMRMEALGGRVCIATIGVMNVELNRSERVDMWVMMEYGVRESWTRIFSVGPTSPTGFFGSAVPLVYLKKGGRVLLNWNCDYFAEYDMKTKSVVMLTVPGIEKMTDAAPCVTSLVWIGGGDTGGSSRKEGEKRKLSGNKKRDNFLSKGFKLVL